MRFIGFISFFFMTAAFVGIYISLRLFKSTKVKRLWRFATGTVVVLIISLTPITIMLRQASLHHMGTTALIWLGYMGLGFISFVFTFLVIRDGVLLINGGFKRIRHLFSSSKARSKQLLKNPDRLPADMGRRRFLVQGTGSGIMAAAAVFTGVGFAEARQLPKVKEDDLADVPAIAKRIARPERDHKKVTDHKQWRKAVQGYLASITFADACLGRVLDALEKSAYKDNTIVVFLTDHGFHLGEKHHWQKATLWEEATHCLLMFRAPGVTRAGA